MADVNFTTGPATLPDVGTLFYNGCTFSPLFETNVAGVAVKDAAGRTTKFMEYTITVDGYVTLAANQDNIAPTMATLRSLLTAQGGTLAYKGRGSDIIVNQSGGTVQDVAWGPVPEILDFQPLGGGLSAKIKWTVKTRIPEIEKGRLNVLQFNYESTLSYDESGFSTISIKGTLEIPLTRLTQTTRTMPLATVDDYREVWLERIATSIDLTRFRVTRREFSVSRDKRTMEWEFQAEELPYMGLPPFVTVAKGSFACRPAKSGMGLCNWLCTLRCTYTVRKDGLRRIAFDSFLCLLRLRMSQSRLAVIPPPPGNQNPLAQAFGALATPVIGAWQLGEAAGNLLRRNLNGGAPLLESSKKCWLIDFNFEEGLYLDSKTVTFSATWRLVSVFSEILRSSGIWKTAPSDGGNAWAVTVRDISGWSSWVEGRLNPAQDVIVDFGGSF